MLSTATALARSPTSSPTLALIFFRGCRLHAVDSGRMPVRASFSCAKAASEPVIVPPMPTLMVSSFWPQLAIAKAHLSSKPSVVSVFPSVSPLRHAKCRRKIKQAVNPDQIVPSGICFASLQGGQCPSRHVQRTGTPVDLIRRNLTRLPARA